MRSNAVSIAATLLVLGAPALAQSTSIVSIGQGAAPSGGRSTLSQQGTVVTPDGRFVVFHSDAGNLVAGDTLGQTDVFVRDNQTGVTERISALSGANEPNGACENGTISDNGRFVVFESDAQNLVPGDFNQARDVFLRDRQFGFTTVISVRSSGQFANGASFQAAISGDGAIVAFASAATDLVANDTNGHVDIFVRNITLGTTRLVTVAPGGANGPSEAPSLSTSGRFLAFQSAASNLVAGDTPGTLDVFVRDIFLNTPAELASLSSAGAPGNGDSRWPSISGDGARVVFTSAATNLAGAGAAGNDVFLRDRTGATTTLVNTLGATTSNASAERGRISRGGEYVTFLSGASNLTTGHSGATVDVFVKQLSTGAIQRASVPTNPAPSEPGAPILVNGGVSETARFVLFSSSASNLVAGDTGTIEDVFARDLQRNYFIDLDGDQFGDESSIVAAAFPPAGFMGVGGDCNDTNPLINPGATEICNGVDDDCDGDTDESNWQRYCQTSISQAGCTPDMQVSGTPSASATSGFNLSITGLPGQRGAALVYGLSQSSGAWDLGSTSERCVGFPWTRVSALNATGTLGQCDGVYTLDWLAWSANNPGAQGQPLTAGSTFYIQGWYRDPGAPKNSNLSDAISFTLCP